MKSKHLLKLIVATEANTGRIGLSSGALPWGHIRTDMKHFAEKTRGNTLNKNSMNACVMGSKTWCSLPGSGILKSRWNWVIGGSQDEKVCDKRGGEKLSLIRSWSNWNDWVQSYHRGFCDVNEIWITGGASIYRQAWETLGDEISEVYWTRIWGPVAPKGNGDVYWTPPMNMNWMVSERNIHEDGMHRLEISRYRNLASEKRVYGGLIPTKDRSHPEYQYLDLVRKVLDTDVLYENRTGIRTKRVWGAMTRWNLARDGFPLLTTKRVFWRAVVEEALWFLRGQTHAHVLTEKGIHIWDENGTTKFLQGRGLDYPEGVLGPVYGWQWRGFGGMYSTGLAKHGPMGRGIDQIQWVLNEMRKDPTTRRAIVSAWNPQQLHMMSLPPCHIMFHLQGEPMKTGGWRLNLLFYQRSADLGLGVPFNIASYALLMHIFARELGWEVGELVHMMGDAHVYENHEDALRVQLEREPRTFPKLVIDVTKEGSGIDSYRWEDFQLEGYHPHKVVKMEMAV